MADDRGEDFVLLRDDILHRNALDRLRLEIEIGSINKW